MIPIYILSKLSKYEVEIGGVKIKTFVADDNSLIERNILKLRYSLQRCVVGVDVKFHIDQNKQKVAKMLILCIANRCLIIQIDQEGPFPKSLDKLFGDESILFVGLEVDKKVTRDYLCSMINSVECIARVEVGDLAARVLKKPSLIKCRLADLAREVGLESVEATCSTSTISSPDWNARVFSEEEIEVAIHEAYTCYCIGSKLLAAMDLPIVKNDHHEKKNSSDHITLRVKDKDLNGILIKMRKDSQLKKLMDAYNVEKNVESNTFVFLFDGLNLRPEQTLHEAGLEDGDEIEALTRDKEVRLADELEALTRAISLLIT